jgi:hypothetical protein
MDIFSTFHVIEYLSLFERIQNHHTLMVQPILSASIGFKSFVNLSSSTSATGTALRFHSDSESIHVFKSLKPMTLSNNR